jgi:hypothetical protein
VKRVTAIPLAAGIGLVLLAAGVQLTAPGDAAQQSAFAEKPAVGHAATGRNVAATVHRFRLARTVHSSEWEGTTPGIWVVAEASVSTVLTEGTPNAVLRIGDVEYLASRRPDFSALNGTSLDPGLPSTGAFLFEIPRAAVSTLSARRATVRIFVDRDPALDSSIEATVDLHRLKPMASYELVAPAGVTP